MAKVDLYFQAEVLWRRLYEAANDQGSAFVFASLGTIRMQDGLIDRNRQIQMKQCCKLRRQIFLRVSPPSAVIPLRPLILQFSTTKMSPKHCSCYPIHCAFLRSCFANEYYDILFAMCVRLYVLLMLSTQKPPTVELRILVDAVCTIGELLYHISSCHKICKQMPRPRNLQAFYNDKLSLRSGRVADKLTFYIRVVRAFESMKARRRHSLDFIFAGDLWNWFVGRSMCHASFSRLILLVKP